MGCSPKCQTIVNFDRVQSAIIKNPHVRTPLDSAVQALRAEPVVIPWSNKYRDGMQLLESGFQERCRIWSEPLTFIKIAPTKQSVGFDFHCKVYNLDQCVAKGLSSPPRSA